MSTSMMLLTLVAAIGIIIFLIMKVRLHAFVTLIVACFFLGFATGMPLGKIASSIEAGMGGTLGFLATILGLGTILGKMMEISGGAERLARTLLDKLGRDKAHWAMMIVGFVCGIPVFFQVGLVLLLPLVFCVAMEAGMSLVAIGIPLVIGLVTVHCVVPPHPAAMAIAGSLKADVGKVIFYGLLVGLPAAAVAGPIYAKFLGPKIKLSPPAHLCKTERTPDEKLPPFGITLFTVLLPLLIMVAKTAIELTASKDASYMQFVNFIGNPITALLISTFFAYWALGLRRGLKMEDLLKHTEGCFAPVAGILLVIGGGGAFNKVLIDSGIGAEVAKVLMNLQISPIMLAWIVAVVVRLAVGSATVSMMTAAGIILPALAAYPALDPAIVCVAIGAGAIMASHVNDSGFWIVKEFYGMSLTDTFKAWTASTAIASFIGLGATLLLAKVLGQG